METTTLEKWMERNIMEKVSTILILLRSFFKVNGKMDKFMEMVREMTALVIFLLDFLSKERDMGKGVIYLSMAKNMKVSLRMMLEMVMESIISWMVAIIKVNGKMINFTEKVVNITLINHITKENGIKIRSMVMGYFIEIINNTDKIMIMGSYYQRF